MFEARQGHCASHFPFLNSQPPRKELQSIKCSLNHSCLQAENTFSPLLIHFYQVTAKRIVKMTLRELHAFRGSKYGGYCLGNVCVHVNTHANAQTI